VVDVNEKLIDCSGQLHLLGCGFVVQQADVQMNVFTESRIILTLYEICTEK